ncbi:Uncharacterised protein [Nocardia brasiliensis]|nr:Uncharacterised protein [Nocardia brasiliensis]
MIPAAAVGSGSTIGVRRPAPFADERSVPTGLERWADEPDAPFTVAVAVCSCCAAGSAAVAVIPAVDSGSTADVPLLALFDAELADERPVAPALERWADEPDAPSAVAVCSCCAWATPGATVCSRALFDETARDRFALARVSEAPAVVGWPCSSVGVAARGWFVLAWAWGTAEAAVCSGWLVDEAGRVRARWAVRSTAGGGVSAGRRGVLVARRSAAFRTKPPPGAMPARRSVRGNAFRGAVPAAPMVMRRNGSRTISSTQVKARVPSRRRVPSAPLISANTGPRSRMRVPSSAGATTPKCCGSAVPAKTTAARRWARAAPGRSNSATASIVPRIRSVETVSPDR